MGRQELILQLNFPFCFHRCAYCSRAICDYDAGVMRSYAEAMIREIEGNAPELQDRSVTAISIEGGCPGLMLPELLQKILQAVRRSFVLADDCFMSVNTVPGEQSRSMMDRLCTLGVNHWNFGIPTANDRLHYLLKRPYNIDALSMVDTAIKNFPLRDLSFELMYGIPGQTKQQFMTDLRKMLEYNPDHISLLCFHADPGSELAHKLETGEITGTKVEDAADMLREAANALKELGMKAYTFCDFAYPGKENRYKLAKLRGTEQLGIGYHAVSFIDGVTYENGHSLNEYLQHSDDLSIIAENLVCPDEKSLLFKSVFSSLCLSAGVDVRELEQSFQDPGLIASTIERLNALTEKGLLNYHEGRYSMTALGAASHILQNINNI